MTRKTFILATAGLLALGLFAASPAHALAYVSLVEDDVELKKAVASADVDIDVYYSIRSHRTGKDEILKVSFPKQRDIAFVAGFIKKLEEENGKLPKAQQPARFFITIGWQRSSAPKNGVRSRF